MSYAMLLRRSGRLSVALVLLMVLAVLAAIAACDPTSSLPGTSEGTFSVVGTLGTNTCGSGVDAESPWDFSVWISEDDGTLYIEYADGSAEFSGTLSGVTATMTSTVTSNPDATEAGAGPCDMTQTTTFTIDLNVATAPTSFTGTATFSYAVSTGVSSTNDCTDQLSSSGGPYSTLPCSVTFSLAGTKQ